MNTIKINYNGNIYEYQSGTSLLEISKDFINDFKHEIIVGQIDGNLCELDQKINKDCTIRFYDLTHHFGNKVYERGLVFLFISAVKELFNCDVRISHSIDKGIYCEIQKEITEENVLNIKSKMREYIDNKIPIEKFGTSRISAMDYYESINQNDKAESLKYEVRSNILLYKFNNIYDYFFGEMPINAYYIKYFDIAYINSNSVVLLLPDIYRNGDIKPYEHYDKIFNAFREFVNWCKCNDIQNVYDLNKIISSRKIEDLIYISELHQNSFLYKTSSLISENKDVKIVLIGGPSSSGKTTTAKKLKSYLKSMGLTPHTLSIDDYFLERDETPKDENGKFDFESLHSIDMKLFNDHLTRLLNGEEVLIPTFNFIDGKKEYKKNLKLENNGILIIEGLHALNDELTSSIDKTNKYKIYISPLTSLNIDNHNRITTSDLRLIRRMVRDNMNRGYNASKTLESWKTVRSGEEKHVFPYQNKCDVVLNSSLVYELGALRVYAEPLLFSIDHDDPNYNEAIRLINLIRNILPIPSTSIPYDSVIREFIGDSYFNKIGEE